MNFINLTAFSKILYPSKRSKEEGIKKKSKKSKEKSTPLIINEDKNVYINNRLDNSITKSGHHNKANESKYDICNNTNNSLKSSNTLWKLKNQIEPTDVCAEIQYPKNTEIILKDNKSSYISYFKRLRKKLSKSSPIRDYNTKMLSYSEDIYNDPLYMIFNLISQKCHPFIKATYIESALIRLIYSCENVSNYKEYIYIYNICTELIPQYPLRVSLGILYLNDPSLQSYVHTLFKLAINIFNVSSKQPLNNTVCRNKRINPTQSAGIITVGNESTCGDYMSFKSEDIISRSFEYISTDTCEMTSSAYTVLSILHFFIQVLAEASVDFTIELSMDTRFTYYIANLLIDIYTYYSICYYKQLYLSNVLSLQDYISITDIYMNESANINNSPSTLSEFNKPLIKYEKIFNPSDILCNDILSNNQYEKIHRSLSDTYINQFNCIYYKKKKKKLARKKNIYPPYNQSLFYKNLPIRTPSKDQTLLCNPSPFTEIYTHNKKTISSNIDHPSKYINTIPEYTLSDQLCHTPSSSQGIIYKNNDKYENHEDKNNSNGLNHINENGNKKINKNMIENIQYKHNMSNKKSNDVGKNKNIKGLYMNREDKTTPTENELKYLLFDQLNSAMNIFMFGDIYIQLSQVPEIEKKLLLILRYCFEVDEGAYNLLLIEFVENILEAIIHCNLMYEIIISSVSLCSALIRALARSIELLLKSHNILIQSVKSYPLISKYNHIYIYNNVDMNINEPIKNLEVDSIKYHNPNSMDNSNIYPIILSNPDVDYSMNYSKDDNNSNIFKSLLKKKKKKIDLNHLYTIKTKHNENTLLLKIEHFRYMSRIILPRLATTCPYHTFHTIYINNHLTQSLIHLELNNHTIDPPIKQHCHFNDILDIKKQVSIMAHQQYYQNNLLRGRSSNKYNQNQYIKGDISTCKSPTFIAFKQTEPYVRFVVKTFFIDIVHNQLETLKNISINEIILYLEQHGLLSPFSHDQSSSLVMLKFKQLLKCSQCGKSNLSTPSQNKSHSGYFCNQCQFVRYCSKACQNKMELLHQHLCHFSIDR